MDVKTSQERKQLLAHAINQQVTIERARVESQSDFQAVLVKGKPVNHVLHTILTFGTCGLWSIIWGAVGVAGGEKRYIVTIDEYGNTNIQK